MAPATVETIPTCHLVAMPYPGRGHINPTMSLCRLLASRSNRILITFVVTEEWLGLIGSDPKPANIRFSTIPNVLPSELVRSTDMVSFFEAAVNKMEEPFDRLLDRLDPPATVIVADTLLSWAVDVGNRRNIPAASLWTMPASVLSIFHHFELMVNNGHFPVELSERGNELVDYIPGVSPIRLADLPTTIHAKDKRIFHGGQKMFSKTNQAQYLLFATVAELEAPAINAYKAKFPFPTYSLGPLIPYSNLQERNNHPDPADYLKWLDTQPESSVLYVSMGSFLSVSSAQLDQIAAGLRDSGVRYLLVARDKASGFKEACGEAGMVVPWCDQLKVLCHSSVGGFWTHCGWNSTMESLFAGVPMLALPITMDQVPNCKFIVEDWKVGRKVKKEHGDGNLVTREEIAELVRTFMDSGSVERKEMMERAREIRDICRGATEKGGSSVTNLNAFIKDISKGTIS